MTTNTPERFREVEPLRLGQRALPDAEIESFHDMPEMLYVRSKYYSIPEVRALRDWLTEALPEEKP